MKEEIREYINYLASINEIKKTKMPKFDLSAYNDNEYKYAIEELMLDFEMLDELYLTLKYLKGD